MRDIWDKSALGGWNYYCRKHTRTLKGAPAVPVVNIYDEINRILFSVFRLGAMA